MNGFSDNFGHSRTNQQPTNLLNKKEKKSDFRSHYCLFLDLQVH